MSNKFLNINYSGLKEVLQEDPDIDSSSAHKVCMLFDCLNTKGDLNDVFSTLHELAKKDIEGGVAFIVTYAFNVKRATTATGTTATTPYADDETSILVKQKVCSVMSWLNMRITHKRGERTLLDQTLDGFVTTLGEDVIKQILPSYYENKKEEGKSNPGENEGSFVWA